MRSKDIELRLEKLKKKEEENKWKVLDGGGKQGNVCLSHSPLYI